MSVAPYPWLHSVLHQWQQQRQRLHHAWLLQGAPGIGKGALARAMAGAMLCEDPQADGSACGRCTGCHLYSLGHHPDIRVLQPPPEEDEKGKRKQPIISIDQVRELADFVGLSSHRGGWRVIIVEPADAMNTAASNALLKTLEEPPPNTLFILLSHQPGRLLPTVRSRCRRLLLPLPPAAEASAWLEQQGLEDAQAWLAQTGGAPLAALAAREDARAVWRTTVLDALRAPQQMDVPALARQLEKSGLATLWPMLTRWVHDLALCHSGAAARYFPREQGRLDELAKRADLFALLRYERFLGSEAPLLHHPLQPRLVLEQWFAEYRGVFRRAQESVK